MLVNEVPETFHGVRAEDITDELVERLGIRVVDASELIATLAVTGVPDEPAPRRRREYDDEPDPAPHEPWRYPDRG